MRILFILYAYVPDIGSFVYYKDRQIIDLRKEIDWVIPETRSVVLGETELDAKISGVFHYLKKKPYAIVELRPELHSEDRVHEFTTHAACLIGEGWRLGPF